MSKESQGPLFGDRLRAAMGPIASPNVLEYWRLAEIAREIDLDVNCLLSTNRSRFWRRTGLTLAVMGVLTTLIPIVYIYFIGGDL